MASTWSHTVTLQGTAHDSYTLSCVSHTATQPNTGTLTFTHAVPEQMARDTLKGDDARLTTRS